MANFVKVAPVDEIKPGTAAAFDVAGRNIAVFNIEGQFYAIDNICPHRAGPLSYGIIQGMVVTCPLHFWQFDLNTGCFSGTTEKGVDTFPVRIEGDELQVEI